MPLIGNRQSLGLLAGPLWAGRTLLSKISPSAAGFLRVLTYHDIPPAELGLFKQQILAIRERYTIIDYATFDRILRGEQPLRGGNVLLTFDDGYISNFAAAQEILNPLGVRAVFFVLPEFIECSDSDRVKFVTDRLFDGAMAPEQVSPALTPMRWEQIDSLARAGHTIGSHSASHSRLSRVKEAAELEAQILKSAEAIERKLGTAVSAFAYPFGDVGSISSKALAVARRRYQYVFSGVRGSNSVRTPCGAIRRDAVNPSDSVDYVKFLLEGGVSPYYWRARSRLDSIAAEAEFAR